MLNSFTPVSSLASTIKSMTEDEQGIILSLDALSKDDLTDINMASSTIKKRSEGLLEFVNDYRTISSVPIPQLKKVNVKQFLSAIQLLMKQSVEDAKIDLQ